MASRRSTWLERLGGVLDVPLALLTVPAAVVLLAFRRVGAARLPLTRGVLRRIGVFPIRDHYYEPLFQPRELRGDSAMDRDLPGIEFNVENQLRLLQELTRAAELTEMRLDRSGPSDVDFAIENPSFGAGDAEFLYQFLRHVRPRRVVEVGGGHSTRIACKALDRNRTETGVAAEHICIEPFALPWLDRLGVEVLRSRVEDCPPTLFDRLEAGDFLFIDSSHIIRPQGDVLFEYLSLIPRLKRGVYVHVHDVFTPRDYPRSWIVDHVRFWNEQYLLEALLTGSGRLEVVAGLNYLHHHFFDQLRRVCPYLTPEREPGSFYVKTV